MHSFVFNVIIHTHTHTHTKLRWCSQPTRAYNDDAVLASHIPEVRLKKMFVVHWEGYIKKKSSLLPFFRVEWRSVSRPLLCIIHTYIHTHTHTHTHIHNTHTQSTSRFSISFPFLNKCYTHTHTHAHIHKNSKIANKTSFTHFIFNTKLDGVKNNQKKTNNETTNKRFSHTLLHYYQNTMLFRTNIRVALLCLCVSVYVWYVYV